MSPEGAGRVPLRPLPFSFICHKEYILYDITNAHYKSLAEPKGGVVGEPLPAPSGLIGSLLETNIHLNGNKCSEDLRENIREDFIDIGLSSGGHGDRDSRVNMSTRDIGCHEHRQRKRSTSSKRITSGRYDIHKKEGS